MSSTNIKNKNISIVDDEVNISSKYTKMVRRRRVELILINNLPIAEQNS